MLLPERCGLCYSLLLQLQVRSFCRDRQSSVQMPSYRQSFRLVAGAFLRGPRDPFAVGKDSPLDAPADVAARLPCILGSKA